jgi:hypothetical protein
MPKGIRQDENGKIVEVEIEETHYHKVVKERLKPSWLAVEQAWRDDNLPAATRLALRQFMRALVLELKGKDLTE